jgi:hypothetical protein
MTNSVYHIQFCAMSPGLVLNMETAGPFLGSDIGRRAGGESSSRRGSECSRSGESSCSIVSHQLGTDLTRRGSSCSRIANECSSLGDMAQDEICVMQHGTIFTEMGPKNKNKKCCISK